MKTAFCLLVAASALTAASSTPLYAAQSPSIELRVFASEAVRHPLQELGYEFEQKHPGVDIHYEFAATRVFAIGTLQGIPPDLFVSAGSKYQDQLTDAAFVNLYSKLAGDKLVAATSCEPPPCCEAPGVSAPASKSLVSSLLDQSVPVEVASPTLSTAGQLTAASFSKIGQRHGGDLERIMAHTTAKIDPGVVLHDVADRKAAIGIVYASQVTGLRRMGECVREIPLPREYAENTNFYVSVLNKTRFHFVTSREAKLDKELQRLYLSKHAQQVFAKWGFEPKAR